MKRLLQCLALMFAGVFASISLASGAAAIGSYNPLNRACNNNTNTNVQNSAICQQANEQQGKDKNPAIDAIAKTAKVLSLIIGFASIIIIVVAGINLITSGGSPENVKSAKSRITSAIVGLIIAALAWVLASFIIGTLL
ncbi:MAG TPA: hypothetical protein VFT49_03360 [Candidatus Saccharimonadales bacterium]|nr:hypothetical protein [Candidatus Saccharimonadales bacterium]